MIGISKLYTNNQLINLSSLTTTEHQQFEISAKKAIAKILNKKTIRIIEK